ncbi:FmdB family zinc ribbon protein [Verrucomicrobium sp. BvORR106]|uniref:FmdB family zinc ribbon protein n=1 Tax=Verrucomicrobium sp. BvORR106 TaxID=1403819 RepID=UPI000571B301|nr:FmdB family zinc ribbon protein [Verrucomicrobium sp. BvORR106]
MPTYEYECTTCGHQFETVQSMKDPHLTDCPQQECAGPVKRKIGRGAGLIFKGTGFYITDYRSDSYKAAAKQDSAGSSASSSSGSSSSSSSSTPSTPASSGSSSSASSSTSTSPKAA